MKKQYLFGALAFSAMFASCNNELDTVAESVKPEIAMKEVVGADLVSNGMTINLGSTESRALNGEWLTTDKLALAWYNVSINGISEVQKSTDWKKLLTAGTTSDLNIYANHKFMPNENGEFVTESNVYQGAHFVYFPYKREAKVQAKEVNVNELAYTAKPENDPNPNTYAYDYYNKAFNLSAQDFIAAEDVDAEGKLTSQFVMSPMVNAINVHAQSSVVGEALKALKITEVTIKSKQSVFADEFTIDPAAVPAVVRDKEGAILTEETIEALDEFAAGLGAGAYKKSITRKVEGGFNLVAETNNVVLYTLPTADTYTGTDKDLTITVKAKSEHGIEATFTVQVKEDETEINNEFLPKLVEHLGESLQAIRRTEAGAWNPLNTKVELTNDNVVITYNIANKDQWDDAVALANDLGDAVTFNLVGDVEFTEVINLPNDGIELTVVSKNAEGNMVINGNVAWPSNEDLNVEAANIIVEEEATLTIDGTKNQRNTLSGKVVNNGTISLNEYGAIKNGVSGKITNNARIDVKYGSYVEATGGIIAFEVENTTAAYQINNLINHDMLGKDVKVNTLVIKDGVTLALNKVDQPVVDADPYTGMVADPIAMPNLSTIDIEMKGGAIEGNKSLTQSVKNVKALAGSSTIKDANIENDLVVEEGANVTIDASEHTYGNTTYKKDVKIGGDIENDGTINALTNIYVTNIDNKNGTIVVDKTDKAYTIWYTEEYYQGGKAEGNVLEQGATEPTAGQVANVANMVEFAAALSNTNITTINLTSNTILQGTIDLKGKTLKANANIHLNNEVVLKNGTIAKPVITNKADANFTFENITLSVDGLGMQAYALQVHKAKNVTIKNSVFNTTGRPVEVGYYQKGTITIEDCLFMNRIGTNNPYILPLDAKGKVIIKGCTFETALTIESLLEGQYTIENNQFEQHLGFAANAITKEIKSYCATLYDANEFTGEYAFSVYAGGKENFFIDANF